MQAMQKQGNFTQPWGYPSAVGIHDGKIGGVVVKPSRDFPDAFDDSFIQKDISANDICSIAVPSKNNRILDQSCVCARFKSVRHFSGVEQLRGVGGDSK